MFVTGSAHGFIAIRPDLFWRQERGVDMTDQTEAEWQKAFSFIRGSMMKLLKTLQPQLSSANIQLGGRVGAVGFCLGSKLAWLLSVRFNPTARLALRRRHREGLE
jgi:carboxymethylenebutenolidase